MSCGFHRKISHKNVVIKHCKKKKTTSFTTTQCMTLNVIVIVTGEPKRASYYLTGEMPAQAAGCW